MDFLVGGISPTQIQMELTVHKFYAYII